MRAIGLMLAKDLRVLVRSPLLLVVLLSYPVVIALLVGLVAGYANAKPRVALVDEDGLPASVEIGGERFDVNGTIREVSSNVDLVRLGSDEAQRELETGGVVAVVTIPDGFIATLRGMSRSPTLELRTTQGGLAPRVTQQVQALVYSLNRQLQSAYIESNLEYVDLILTGGRGSFFGRDFDVLGLAGTRDVLEELPAGPRLDNIREFVRIAQLALAQTGDALRATANPIELREDRDAGRTWALSAQVQSYALALTIALLTLMLGAASLAAERDEGAAARLLRGLVGRGQLVAAKVALSAVLAVVLGMGIALAFGAAIELGDVTGGEPWARLPLLAVGLALAGGSLGALGALIGALGRDARTASLIAILVALPIVFLGLVPGQVVPAAARISDALPFAHAVRFFSASLFDADPWGAVVREALWLGGLTLVFGGLARVGVRRLLT